MCIQPIQLKKNPDGVKVPCGRCTRCRARRVSAWSFRLMEQEKVSFNPLFITLTYDTKNVPINVQGYMDLSKAHLKQFFKRLRRANAKIRGFESLQIKYYLAGEYGGRTNRPHYHIILFNCSTDVIQRAWEHGSVHYGRVSGASIGYTLKYISKQSKIPQHKNDTRQKEFSLISKGIGINYINSKANTDWHKADIGNRCFVNLGEGKKASMPRYYKDKIYGKDERLLVSECGIERAIRSEERIFRDNGIGAILSARAVMLQHEKSIINLPIKDNL